jgi:hypothetical protein
MRDARINMIGEGSNDVLRVFIGAVGLRDLGMHLQSLLRAAKNPFGGLGALYKLTEIILKGASKPSIPVQSPLFREEAQRLSRSIRRFAFSILRLLARHKEAVVEEQLRLNRIAESALSLYTVTAVLSKIDHKLQHAPGEGPPLVREVAVARFYCNYALDKLDRSLGSLFADNRDKEIRSLSDILTGGPVQ